MEVLQSTTTSTFRTKTTTIFNKRKTKPKHLHHPKPTTIRTTTTTTNITKVSYPKPTPTPLLTSRTSATKTRSQLLDEVLADLEAAAARGAPADASLLSSLLETCFQTDHLAHGVRLHRLIPPPLLRGSADLTAKLARIYAACGLMDDAHRLFDEMPHRIRCKSGAFPWNCLISGYVEAGALEDAMALYYQMEEDGVAPDKFTFPRVLKACAGIGSAAAGEGVHRHAVRAGLGADPFVLNALVDMYAKCGDIVKARKVFDAMTEHDTVSWNSMIVGYARHGLHLEALGVWRKMVSAGVDPDVIAVSALLPGLSSVSRLGLEVHGWALRRGLDKNMSVANALIGMYSYMGCTDRARIVFEAMPEKDIVSWNAIICAHRRSQKALDLFWQMEDSGMEVPDPVTFVAMLSACANLGLVEDGREVFCKMEEKYKIKAKMEHYGCMVNLLGKAGLVDEAFNLVTLGMPFDAGPTVWGALLYACSLHGDVRVGEVAAEKLFELEPDNAHNFELLMKIYGKNARWEDVERVRKRMEDRGLDLSQNCNI